MPTAAGPPTGRLFFAKSAFGLPPEPQRTNAYSPNFCIFIPFSGESPPSTDLACTRTPVPNPLILSPLISIDPELPLVVHRLHATLSAIAMGWVGWRAGETSWLAFSL